MGTTSVRRNLFHHHLSRRPGATGPAASSTQDNASNGASGLPSHLPQSTSSDSSSSLSSGPIDNGEIVVKDKNGSYKLDIPVLPPLVGEDGDEMEGIEGSGAMAGNGSGQTGMSGSEKEKMEATLAEMISRHRTRQMSSEPAEILDLIHQTLRDKVAALEEDNWMYEAEVDTRV
ncbi:hypothetical protein BO70DRAFT_429100 [Aspergillus heteromorphus CBS 117.55]|uniref:Uncharacterized protein n=1 Tax=Aspergillus heteromorphus CBS 117.55 TaxID=1448321 RepID=A0A317W9M0_9EURO|nr:uncharacterized protein BO70DRAFT_429100 [Aspergillus heteromorphus CBS 117.55]PWY83043.1 hypothetical protein BO70DRAFT_429100 [Aspergillus heteromorphus CBS 117.55]